ncbi:MAG TPA: hypothetical protein VMU29_11295 [Smithella sp.]|nr:hypothetical protein [Smithella sp.]
MTVYDLMHNSEAMKLIKIKYCGGCNPAIDRAKLVHEIQELLPPEFILSESKAKDKKDKWDIGILVCGCLTACANKPDFKNIAVKWILIAGNSIDHDNAPEKDLADIVVAKLKQ